VLLTTWNWDYFVRFWQELLLPWLPRQTSRGRTDGHVTLYPSKL